jgi:catechol 2,3-dioxygenase-like lactoylglutathione lyase family enzyme
VKEMPTMEASLEGIALLVDDVHRSKEFYLRIPGATLLHERGSHFALVQIGHARINLLRAGDLPPGAPLFHLEVTASDVDALYEQLREAGVTTDGPPAERSWGDRSSMRPTRMGTTSNSPDPGGRSRLPHCYPLGDRWADNALAGMVRVRPRYV